MIGERVFPGDPNQTMFIVKPMPDVVGHLELEQVAAMRDEILAKGFRLRISTDHLLGEEDLRMMYPGVSDRLWDATVAHLSGQRVIKALLGGGADSIERLADLVGRNVSPKSCGPGTLRYRYGCHVPVQLGEGLIYWCNAIHCPRTAEDAKREIAWFFTR